MRYSSEIKPSGHAAHQEEQNAIWAVPPRDRVRGWETLF